MESNYNIEVLIVEDEADICYLLGGILKKKNIFPGFATSLLEANKAVNQFNPNILFIDNHLPDGFGVDFVHKVKIEHPETRIVMITAHDSAKDRKKAVEQGVDYFISKPFTSDTINSTLDRLMIRPVEA